MVKKAVIRNRGLLYFIRKLVKHFILRKVIYKFGKKILITGCGRSGTRYTAIALTKMGLPMGHEDIAKFGTVAWQLAVDSRHSICYRNIKLRDYNFKIILHQVRHPLTVIRSMHELRHSSWYYIEKFIPIHKDDSLLLKCMKYWYYWNLEAEKISSWTYRIEDLPNIFDVFCQKIKHPELIAKKHILGELRTNIHSKETPCEELAWEKLEKEDKELCLKIKELARKYGYQVQK